MMNTWRLWCSMGGTGIAATLLAIWFKISTALSEIVVARWPNLVIGVLTGPGLPRGDSQEYAWITFSGGERVQSF